MRLKWPSGSFATPRLTTRRVTWSAGCQTLARGTESKTHLRWRPIPAPQAVISKVTLRLFVGGGLMSAVWRSFVRYRLRRGSQTSVSYPPMIAREERHRATNILVTATVLSILSILAGVGQMYR